MPAAGKMSSASMHAEPTMPNTSLTPFATSVSTNASEGVISVGLPVVAGTAGAVSLRTIVAIVISSLLESDRKSEHLVAQVVPIVESALAQPPEWREGTRLEAAERDR